MSDDVESWQMTNPDQLQGILGAAPVIVYSAVVRDDRLEPRWVSHNIERILGYTVAEVLDPKWWWQHVHPEDRSNVWLAGVDPDQPGRHEHEYRFRHADGSWRWIHEQVTWERAGTTGVTGVVGSWMDVTASKQQEEKLVESEERFRQLVAHIPQVFWMNGADGALVYVSPSYERVWGRAADELFANRSAWRDALHPEDRERVVAFLAAHRGTEYELRYRIVRPDGMIRWICDRGFPVRDAAGRFHGMAGVAEDLTENVLARERTRWAEAHYSRLITTSPYAIYMLDAEGSFSELNPAAEQLLGARADELLGRSFLTVIAPEAREEMSRVFDDMVEGTLSSLVTDVAILRADGERRFVSVTATVIRTDDRFDGAHGIARDITEERERDHRIRMLAEALDRLPDGVSIEHEDGTVIYANDAYRELIDGADEDFGLTGLQALLARDTPDAERMEIRDLLAHSGGWRGRTVRRHRDAQVPIEIVARRLELDNHEVTILLARDVTEQAARELQLRRTERLASIGTLIGGVAHELNNPLTAIAGFIELMLDEPRSDEERETLETIRRETARVGKIVADLRQLARESVDVTPRDLQPIDVNDIIHHVVRVRRYALETSNIDVQLDLADDLPAALGVPSEIEQVVLNLVVNASHSLEKSGRSPRMVTIRSARTRTGVAFEVIDNGMGIPEHVLDRIFDPFFTTKPPGEGTGLGLSLVHSIVSEHGGRISVNSIEGRGAAFSVWLPLAQVPEHALQPAAVPRDGPPPRILRVLVVDDERAIRIALVRHLRRRGHDVEDAADGAEALQRITREPFDVIVSDIRMPGMSGDRLLRQLVESGATDAVHRLLFMTGDPTSEDAPYSLDGRRVPVVAKPFTLAEITRAIETHADAQ